MDLLARLSSMIGKAGENEGIFENIHTLEAIAKLSHSVIPAMIFSGKTKFNVHNLVLTA